MEIAVTCQPVTPNSSTKQWPGSDQRALALPFTATRTGGVVVVGANFLLATSRPSVVGVLTPSWASTWSASSGFLVLVVLVVLVLVVLAVLVVLVKVRRPPSSSSHLPPSAQLPERVRPSRRQ